MRSDEIDELYPAMWALLPLCSPTPHAQARLAEALQREGRATTP